MKTKQIREALADVGIDVVSAKKDGTYVAKSSYFYRSQGDGVDRLRSKVLRAIPTAVVVDDGDHWHAFCGGAPSGSTKDSYFWVQFKI